MLLTGRPCSRGNEAKLDSGDDCRNDFHEVKQQQEEKEEEEKELMSSSG